MMCSYQRPLMAFGRLDLLLFCTASRTNSHSLCQVTPNGLGLVGHQQCALMLCGSGAAEEGRGV